MSASEPEQAEPVLGERQMLISGCACGIGEVYEKEVIGQNLSRANENKKLAKESICFLRNYIFVGII